MSGYAMLKGNPIHFTGPVEQHMGLGYMHRAQIDTSWCHEHGQLCIVLEKCPEHFWL